jgi:Rrf2 family protein
MATDYGILALGYLSQRENGRLACAKEISEAYKIPPELLAKILQKLARSGLVKSHSGPTGGYVLAREPRDITVSDIIQSIEGPIHLVRCLNDDLCCMLSHHCDIQEPMKYIQDRVLGLFDSITLEEIRGKCRTPEGVKQ